jgi:glycosyltransferase involved in cell wall biosynthesis
LPAVSIRVVLLRGPAASEWELRPWEQLAPDYAVSLLVPEGNLYATSALKLERVSVRTLGDRLPGGRIGHLATRAVGERYIGLREQLAGSDIVHAAELGYWFSAQAARLKSELGFKLVLTVWETLPFRNAYRNVRTRRYRRETLQAADLFLATTDRARQALLLEGARDEQIMVCPPGIDMDRFATGQDGSPRPDGAHVVLSIGRLVWEKGHQDLLRAVALLRRRGRDDVRVELVGTGPERGRLERVADDLGLADVVVFRGNVPHRELPGLYARASCLVLASLPTPFWEEQFGMVLAEALAARVPIVASRSGAIPEVLGDDGSLVAPGDWVGLAAALAEGPLAARPGTRSTPSSERVDRLSTTAAAARLRGAYEVVLAS